MPADPLPCSSPLSPILLTPTDPPTTHCSLFHTDTTEAYPLETKAEQQARIKKSNTITGKIGNVVREILTAISLFFTLLFHAITCHACNHKVAGQLQGGKPHTNTLQVKNPEAETFYHDIVKLFLNSKPDQIYQNTFNTIACELDGYSTIREVVMLTVVTGVSEIKEDQWPSDFSLYFTLKDERQKFLQLSNKEQQEVLNIDLSQAECINHLSPNAKIFVRKLFEKLPVYSMVTKGLNEIFKVIAQKLSEEENEQYD